MGVWYDDIYVFVSLVVVFVKVWWRESGYGKNGDVIMCVFVCCVEDSIVEMGDDVFLR